MQVASMHFKERAHVRLNDDVLQQNLQKIKGKFVANRKKAIVEFGEDPKDYEWYLDTRRFGNVQHAGFGMGMERLIQWICKLEHIRDAVAFPRTPARFSP